MSITFSDNFNTPQIVGGSYKLASGWLLTTSGTPTMFPAVGGCGYGDGVGQAGKFWVACSGNGQTTHAFTGTATVSLRTIICAEIASGTWESMYAWCPTGPAPGFTFILQMNSAGGFSIRTNNVSSVTLSPSAGGVFPTDGTPFALQWRMTLNSTTSVAVAVDVNNVNVWSHTYTATDNSLGTNQWPNNACGTSFTNVSLLGSTNNIGFDNLEVDNSASTVTWSVPANTPSLGQIPPTTTIDSVALVVGSSVVQIHGSNFRSRDSASLSPAQSPPTVLVKDPNGNVTGATVTSATTTDITADFGTPATSGSWCADVVNSANCWEGSPVNPGYTCAVSTPLIGPIAGTATAIRRMRRAPHLSTEQLWNFYKRIQVDISAGQGTPTGQGQTPKMMIRWSDDGGYTWGPETTMSLGVGGAYKTRAYLINAGRSRDRIFEVSMSDPVFCALLDAFIDVERGTH